MFLLISWCNLKGAFSLGPMTLLVNWDSAFSRRREGQSLCGGILNSFSVRKAKKGNWF
jgi:hypothetical protein